MASDDKGHHAPPVGFLELFYDLVFVAATMVLSNEFAHDPTWRQAGVCALMFALLWLLWFHTTVLMNIERRDDLGQRGLIFAQMLLIFMATLTFVDREIASADLVGGIYLLAVLVVAYAHHRIRDAAPPIGDWAVARRNRLVLAGLVMAFGIVIPDGPDIALYGLAVLLLVVPTSLTVRGLPVPPVDEHHLSERAALLTLIVMGESFVKTALVVTAGAITGWDVIAIITMFVVLFGFFSAYFDDVPKAGIRNGALFGELWMLAHLVLQLSIVGVAVGISKYLQIGVGAVPSVGVVVLMDAYIGIYIGLALIGEFDRRVPRAGMVTLHAATAAVALVAGLLTLAVEPITPGMYLLTLAVLSIVNAFVGERLRARTTVAPSTETALFVEQSG
jgi:low temperature requirement protein LtrA